MLKLSQIHSMLYNVYKQTDRIFMKQFTHQRKKKTIKNLNEAQKLYYLHDMNSVILVKASFSPSLTHSLYSLLDVCACVRVYE